MPSFTLTSESYSAKLKTIEKATRNNANFKIRYRVKAQTRTKKWLDAHECCVSSLFVLASCAFALYHVKPTSPNSYPSDQL